MGCVIRLMSGDDTPTRELRFGVSGYVMWSRCISSYGGIALPCEHALPPGSGLGLMGVMGGSRVVYPAHSHPVYPSGHIYTNTHAYCTRSSPTGC